MADLGPDTAFTRLAGASIQRIRRGCSHARVPAAPAARGYRYVDLGGETPPFYLRRFRCMEESAAVLLVAPVEESTGDEAERGAAGIARAIVVLGARKLPWASLPAIERGEGAAAVLLADAVEELAGLELLEADDCPVCRDA